MAIQDKKRQLMADLLQEEQLRFGGGRRKGMGLKNRDYARLLN